ncbi:MAG TPA: hypothetical protein VGB56_01915 [Flavisolibacter sp.]|jgi:hypothetical protein
MWHHFFIVCFMVTGAEDIVPEQNVGAESNTEARKVYPTVDEARRAFTRTKERLQTPNQWQQYAGSATAKFILCDSTGAEVERAPEVGDHFKIDIPGPGPLTGDGFDWVKIEAIEEEGDGEEERAAIRVRPATNPQNQQSDVAHFFSDEATSNFIVQRRGLEVIAAVLGRNEKPNTGAEKIIDKARNTAVATGAVTAFSKLQWKSLVNGLLGDDK